MQALQDRITRDGKNLDHGILKVDSFINHQVDPELMDACGAGICPPVRGRSAPPAF